MLTGQTQTNGPGPGGPCAFDYSNDHRFYLHRRHGRETAMVIDYVWKHRRRGHVVDLVNENGN
jgi:hypothetical protein